MAHWNVTSQKVKPYIECLVYIPNKDFHSHFRRSTAHVVATVQLLYSAQMASTFPCGHTLMVHISTCAHANRCSSLRWRNWYMLMAKLGVVRATCLTLDHCVDTMVYLYNPNTVNCNWLFVYKDVSVIYAIEEVLSSQAFQPCWVLSLWTDKSMWLSLLSSTHTNLAPFAFSTMHASGWTSKLWYMYSSCHWWLFVYCEHATGYW